MGSTSILAVFGPSCAENKSDIFQKLLYDGLVVSLGSYASEIDAAVATSSDPTDVPSATEKYGTAVIRTLASGCAMRILFLPTLRQFQAAFEDTVAEAVEAGPGSTTIAVVYVGQILHPSGDWVLADSTFSGDVLKLWLDSESASTWQPEIQKLTAASTCVQPIQITFCTPSAGLKTCWPISKAKTNYVMLSKSRRVAVQLQTKASWRINGKLTTGHQTTTAYEALVAFSNEMANLHWEHCSRLLQSLLDSPDCSLQPKSFKPAQPALYVLPSGPGGVQSQACGLFVVEGVTLLLGSAFCNTQGLPQWWELVRCHSRLDAVILPDWSAASIQSFNFLAKNLASATSDACCASWLGSLLAAAPITPGAASPLLLTPPTSHDFEPLRQHHQGLYEAGASGDRLPERKTLFFKIGVGELSLQSLGPQVGVLVIWKPAGVKAKPLRILLPTSHVTESTPEASLVGVLRMLRKVTELAPSDASQKTLIRKATPGTTHVPAPPSKVASGTSKPVSTTGTPKKPLPRSMPTDSTKPKPPPTKPLPSLKSTVSSTPKSAAPRAPPSSHPATTGSRIPGSSTSRPQTSSTSRPSTAAAAATAAPSRPSRTAPAKPLVKMTATSTSSKRTLPSKTEVKLNAHAAQVAKTTSTKPGHEIKFDLAGRPSNLPPRRKVGEKTVMEELDEVPDTKAPIIKTTKSVSPQQELSYPDSLHDDEITKVVPTPDTAQSTSPSIGVPEVTVPQRLEHFESSPKASRLSEGETDSGFDHKIHDTVLAAPSALNECQKASPTFEEIGGNDVYGYSFSTELENLAAAHRDSLSKSPETLSPCDMIDTLLPRSSEHKSTPQLEGSSSPICQSGIPFTMMEPSEVEAEDLLQKLPASSEGSFVESLEGTTFAALGDSSSVMAEPAHEGAISMPPIEKPSVDEEILPPAEEDREELDTTQSTETQRTEAVAFGDYGGSPDVDLNENMKGSRTDLTPDQGLLENPTPDDLGPLNSPAESPYSPFQPPATILLGKSNVDAKSEVLTPEEEEEETKEPDSLSDNFAMPSYSRGDFSVLSDFKNHQEMPNSPGFVYLQSEEAAVRATSTDPEVDASPAIDQHEATQFTQSPQSDGHPDGLLGFSHKLDFSKSPEMIHLDSSEMHSPLIECSKPVDASPDTEFKHAGHFMSPDGDTLSPLEGTQFTANTTFSEPKWAGLNVDATHSGGMESPLSPVDGIDIPKSSVTEFESLKSSDSVQLSFGKPLVEEIKLESVPSGQGSLNSPLDHRTPPMSASEHEFSKSPVTEISQSGGNFAMSPETHFPSTHELVTTPDHQSTDDLEYGNSPQSAQSAFDPQMRPSAEEDAVHQLSRSPEIDQMAKSPLQMSEPAVMEISSGSPVFDVSHILTSPEMKCPMPSESPQPPPNLGVGVTAVVPPASPVDQPPSPHADLSTPPLGETMHGHPPTTSPTAEEVEFPMPEVDLDGSREGIRREVLDHVDSTESAPILMPPIHAEMLFHLYSADAAPPLDSARTDDDVMMEAQPDVYREPALDADIKPSMDAEIRTATPRRHDEFDNEVVSSTGGDDEVGGGGGGRGGEFATDSPHVGGFSNQHPFLYNPRQHTSPGNPFGDDAVAAHTPETLANPLNDSPARGSFEGPDRDPFFLQHHNNGHSPLTLDGSHAMGFSNGHGTASGFEASAVESHDNRQKSSTLFAEPADSTTFDPTSEWGHPQGLPPPTYRPPSAGKSLQHSTNSATSLASSKAPGTLPPGSVVYLDVVWVPGYIIRVPFEMVTQFFTQVRARVYVLSGECLHPITGEGLIAGVSKWSKEEREAVGSSGANGLRGLNVVPSDEPLEWIRWLRMSSGTGSSGVPSTGEDRLKAVGLTIQPSATLCDIHFSDKGQEVKCPGTQLPL